MSKNLIARMENLVPHLSRAADMADEEERDGDAALFGASVALFQSIGAALHNDSADTQLELIDGAAPAVVPLAAKPEKKPVTHRHVYQADGKCGVTVTDGSRKGLLCLALSREAKKAAATPPAAPPAGGGSAS